ncbi:MAG: hypothetical protein IJA31_04980 [Clostridia bacterium]|nr:hypothetical protein [Clostridia bacterium]
MKKFAMILVFCLLFAASACVQAQNDPSQVTEPTNAGTQPDYESYTFSHGPDQAVFEGMIVAKTGNTLLVTQKTGDGTTAGLYKLSSDYLFSSQDASMLVPGRYFSLLYGGFVMESYPMQFGNPVQFICRTAKEDIVTPLFEFVRDKIPDSADWLALDLTGVENLSDGECAAVEYLLQQQTGETFSVVHYDSTYPPVQEYLNGENAPANGAHLSVEAQLQNGKLVGTWRLTDTQTVTEGTADLPVVYYLN